MYRKYRIVESIASSVSQYESYRDQVYRYTPSRDHYICGIWQYKMLLQSKIIWEENRQNLGNV